jgi:hypothetical protein
VALAVPLLLVGVVLALLPHEVFWITDGGNKYVQVQDLALSGAGDLAVAYPARPLDPELRFFPYGGHHFQKLGGRILSFYPPYFPLLSLPGYRLLGPAGLYLLPWLGFALVLVGFAALLGEIGLAAWRAPAVFAFALGTPLLFYGLTFWEHTPAVALSTAAVFLLVRAGGRFPLAFAAGIILGASTALREEGYALAAALALAGLIAWKKVPVPPAAAFVLGWACAMAPIWWFQARLYGSPLGLHALAYGSLSRPRGAARWLAELGDLPFYLFRFHPDLRFNVALVAPFVLLLLLGLRRPRQTGRAEPALLWLAAASAALLIALLVVHPEPVFNTLSTQGLLPHTPLLLLVLLRLRALLGNPSSPIRFLAWACLLYTLLIALPLHRADVGILWGPRHFLPIYPLLFALALLALRDLLAAATPSRRRALATAAAVLALLGLAVQVHGLRLLALKKEATHRILQAVRDTPAPIVVTDAYWLPEELGALWFEKSFLFVSSDADYRDLMARLAARGPDQVTVVLARRYGNLSPPSLLDLRARTLDAEPVATPGVGFLDVMVLSCRVR